MGIQIKKLAQLKGITLKELSESSLVPYSTLTKFVQERCSIQTDRLERILQSLGVDINSILEAKSSAKVPSYVLKHLRDLGE